MQIIYYEGNAHSLSQLYCSIQLQESLIKIDEILIFVFSIKYDNFLKLWHLWMETIRTC